VSAIRGIPFVVAAASGTGKTSVCRALIARNPGRPIEFSVSHTTRNRREGEADGVDYHFVTASGFQQLVEDDGFLEWAVYNDNHYGTSWRAIEEPLASGHDVLLEIEVQGAALVRNRLDDARFLFLLPPTLAALRQRLESRGTDSPEQMARRLERSRDELAAAVDFDYAVVNDDFDACVADVLAILEAERAGDVAVLRRRFAPAPALRALRAEEPA